MFVVLCLAFHCTFLPRLAARQSICVKGLFCFVKESPKPLAKREMQFTKREMQR